LAESAQSRANRHTCATSLQLDASLAKIVLLAFPTPHRKADALQKKNWIPISLTNSLERRIFAAADCTAEGYRMRSNDKPVVGDMRKRMTRRCVSAATGACC
jgi:hypothetical protein